MPRKNRYLSPENTYGECINDDNFGGQFKSCTLTKLKHPICQDIRTLRSLAYRHKEHRLLVEGITHLEWATSGPLSEVEYLVFEDTPEGHELLTMISSVTTYPIRSYPISSGVYRQLTTSQREPIMGVVKILPMSTINEVVDITKTEHLPTLCLVMDNLQDPGNFGSNIRSAEAFGVQEVINIGAIDAYSKQAIVSSRGRVFHMPIKNFLTYTEAVDYLRKNDYKIIATNVHKSDCCDENSLKTLSDGKPLALIVGNETDGVSHELIKIADYTVHIPMAEGIESLNVCVATGILLHTLSVKRCNIR